jgi:hypothetical protein
MMSDFEEKDVIANAGFDKFVAERNLIVGNEESREFLFLVWVGGMQFMLQQLAPYFDELRGKLQ